MPGLEYGKAELPSGYSRYWYTTPGTSRARFARRSRLRRVSSSADLRSVTSWQAPIEPVAGRGVGVRSHLRVRRQPALAPVPVPDAQLAGTALPRGQTRHAGLEHRHVLVDHQPLPAAPLEQLGLAVPRDAFHGAAEPVEGERPVRLLDAGVGEVGRALRHAPKALLALAQRRLRLLASGDVAADAEDAHELTVAREHGGLDGLEDLAVAVTGEDDLLLVHGRALAASMAALSCCRKKSATSAGRKSWSVLPTISCSDAPKKLSKRRLQER